MEFERRTEKRTRKTFGSFAKFFSIAMGLIYLGFGSFVIFSDPDQIQIDQGYKYILGGVLIAYGFLRFFRAYQQQTKDKRNKYEQ